MTIFVCRACDRNAQGLCRDCPAELNRDARGSPMRCTPCAKRQKARRTRQWERDHPDAIRAQVRVYVRRPEVKERRRKQLAEFFARHPKVRRAYLHRRKMREERAA